MLNSSVPIAFPFCLIVNRPLSVTGASSNKAANIEAVITFSTSPRSLERSRPAIGYLSGYEFSPICTMEDAGHRGVSPVQRLPAADEDRPDERARGSLKMTRPAKPRRQSHPRPYGSRDRRKRRRQAQ